jgi:hypothetical protein
VTNTKALPDPPAILPNGELDCDPDPRGEIFSELAEFSTGLPEVLSERRRSSAAQHEAEESAMAVARAAERARLEVQREHATAIKPIRRMNTLTDAQKRTRKIRAWMLSQSARPDLETYWRAMDAARIPPPPACFRAGKRTFEESFKVPSLRRSISAEFSRLWRTRSPQ